MADLTLIVGDTWPPIRGLAADEDGPLPLPDADEILLELRSDTALITGPVEVIEPPEVDGEDTFNWRYTPDADDTVDPDTYSVRLKITWDAASVPPKIQRVPNVAPPTIEVIEP